MAAGDIWNPVVARWRARGAGRFRPADVRQGAEVGRLFQEAKASVHSCEERFAPDFVRAEEESHFIPSGERSDCMLARVDWIKSTDRPVGVS